MSWLSLLGFGLCAVSALLFYAVAAHAVLPRADRLRKPCLVLGLLAAVLAIHVCVLASGPAAGVLSACVFFMLMLSGWPLLARLLERRLSATRPSPDREVR